MGRRERMALIPSYQQCDLLVMASLYEPVGFTGLEAMACGKAVIASRNSGLAEWIQHGVSGLLFEPGCPQDLTQKVLQFLQLPQSVRDQIGVAAHRVVEQFSFQSIGQRLTDLYASVLANHGG